MSLERPREQEWVFDDWDQRDAPRFSAEHAASLARDLFGIAGVLQPLPSERDQNFLVRETPERAFVLKIANAAERREVLEAQSAVTAHVARCDPSIRCQRTHPTTTGTDIAEAEGADGRRHFVRLLTYLTGATLAATTPRSPALLRSVGHLLGRLGIALEGFTHPAARRRIRWDLASAPRLIASHLDAVSAAEGRLLLERLLERAADSAMPAWPELPRSVIHNDANDHNVLVGGDGTASGLLDFGDMVESATVAEVAVGAAYVALDAPDPVVAAAEVVRGYHEVRALQPLECELLNDLIVLRLGLSVTLAALQRRLDPSNAYLGVSERAAWRALARLLDLDPARTRSAYRRACGMKQRSVPAMSRDEILAARRRHFGRGLSLHYEEPLHVVRGWMQYLYDETGRQYLDAVNNVAQVGHCHPAVVRAAERQMATLNTNTRYLYAPLAAYVERLTALFPDPLRVCYLVCSGSEANELALRLARAHTGRRDVIVIDHAYHGNTTTLVEISPYKYSGPGGRGAVAWVHQAQMPDIYRGAHRDPRTAAAEYAADLERAVAHTRERGRGVAAFICESLMGCGGQIVLPDGYLQAAYRHVRAAGGVCIADEVQVGLGRVGTHLWGFETQGVVPDIVTLGKPIGNGHPIGAVITTPEVAASFDTGMEYFNTFGGNPVSCAVGLAVLDVLEGDGLQERAHVVGTRLAAGLEALAADHAVIGEVRGLGLFLGVDLVTDRETREPAPALARRVVEEMKGRGVLIGVEGHGRNVLKIKPPLVFSEANADVLVETLGGVLSEHA